MEARGDAASKQQIVITSIPYGVNKGKLEAAIGEIIADRKLPQLLEPDQRDRTRRTACASPWRSRPDADPNLSWRISTSTRPCRRTSPYNLTCLVPDAGRQAAAASGSGLKEILRYFLDFRLATVRRRFEFELEQLRKRIHILEGFQIIFNALDKAIS